MARSGTGSLAYWPKNIPRDGDMQLHVHSQIAHTARTGVMEAARAGFLGLQRAHRCGRGDRVSASGRVAFRRFGLEWVARDDGHGFEIKGISGQMMRLFSSRRASITADLRFRAARFEQRYGRAPTQRELAQLAQASNFKTRAAKEDASDFAQLHTGWADKLARTLGVSLASAAPSVWHGGGTAGAPARPRWLGAAASELKRAVLGQHAGAATLAQQGTRAPAPRP